MRPEQIAAHNELSATNVARAYEALSEELAARGQDIEVYSQVAADFHVAVPSWGVGTGGTRFARFPESGEPENIFDKLNDCAVINDLVRFTDRVSPHIPWDKTNDAKQVREHADSLGLKFDAVNSNTFQNYPAAPLSYKYGSLSHTNPKVRQQAVAHNIECIEIGKEFGSSALTVWIADGGNFPGQQNLAKSFERYLDSMSQIYAALPDDWRVYIEYKLFEPAFYNTVINDWGTSYLAASQLGDKAFVLVDLGHHAPGTNVETIIARLLGADKLGGFHFNDNNYGDDDVDSGSSNPYRLFLIFNEMFDAQQRGRQARIDYMIDQSHNVTDPIESLVLSALEIQRAHVQAALIDRAALHSFQDANDAVMATQELKRAYTTDVGPILALARQRAGGALDPIGCYRASGYRAEVAKVRKAKAGSGGGIV